MELKKINQGKSTSVATQYNTAQPSRRIRIVLVIMISLFVSLLTSLSTCYFLNGSFPSITVSILVSFYFLLPFAVVALIFSPVSDRIATLGFTGRAALLLACWLPFLLAVYPGNIRYNDTCFQINQFLGNPMPDMFATLPGYPITDHHPIFDTAVFGSFILLGETLFSSGNIGFFLYTLAQAVLTSSSFSFGIELLAKHGTPHRVRAGIILFLACCPLLPFAVCSMAKDTLHAPIFMLFCFLFAEVCFDKRLSVKRLAALIALGILATLTKKTGYYLILLSLLALVIILRKKARIGALFAIAALFLVNSVLMPRLVLPAFNVSPGSSIEALAIPIQQVSRAVVDHPDGASDEEREAIDALIGYDTIAERFNSRTVDGVKGLGADTNVNYYPSGGTIAAFMKAWLTMGIKYPMSYIYATAELETGWFTLNTPPSWFDMLSEHDFPIQPPNGATTISRPEMFRTSSTAIAQTWSVLGRTGGFSIFFQPALYAIVIPIVVAATRLIRHQRQLPMLPLYLSVLMLFLSPVSFWNECVRYALPLIYLAPFALGCCFTSTIPSTKPGGNATQTQIAPKHMARIDNRNDCL
ncbi:DUF6020 family protein [Collinsella tanakaei]|uniref:DUF6020 family protein n=1 Tax=Collinsella tanakaei TaxID=626935 RepID=UPI0025A4B4C2|nr:DUF6020 family protein [Collinsella tanakaei]MDM8245532.1 DUF6020 family protein [Collinsella tanakaei]